MSTDDKQAPRHWRSLDDLERTPAFLEQHHRELPPDATEIAAPEGVSRRRFICVMGASTALAGIGLGGCVRKPREKILPYAERPEDLIPGQPRMFATAAAIGGTVEGLLVESQDNRPTKIEGNPRHPMSEGATSAFAQAEVLSLYDPARSRHPLEGGKKSTWDRFLESARGLVAELEADGGARLAVLTAHVPSPTYHALLATLRKRLPRARIYLHDAAARPNTAAGLALVGAQGTLPLYAFDRARVVLALDADPLGSEGDTVRNARLFARARQVQRGEQMCRLYAVDPLLTVTGTMADHRLPARPSAVAGILATLAAQLARSGGAEALSRVLPEGGASAAASASSRWIGAVARDLAANRGRSLVVVGERQPPAVHALGLLVNRALGNVGETLELRDDPGALPDAGSVVELARALAGGKLDTLLMLGVNPVYDAPAELAFGDQLARAKTTIHHGLHVDETGRRATWHLPRSHFLEAWGDVAALDGTLAIQQPLIAPLFDSRSELELLAGLLGSETQRGYELVQERWRAELGAASFDASWPQWLAGGVVSGIPSSSARPAPAPAAGTARELAAALRGPGPQREGLELVLRLDPKLFDGRYAGNGWLQELPDPTAKLTWDNAAMMSPATARELGLRSFDMIELAAGDRRLAAAAFVVPGTVDGAVVLSLGYGREAGGPVAEGVGFDAYRLRTADQPYFRPGLRVAKLGRRYPLATTQDHGSMEGRPLVLEATIRALQRDPKIVQKQIPHPPLVSLWTPPNKRSGYQWGMSIDLNLCNGCSACVVACQAENNIPVVGKRRVLEGREMHWLRIDRYFAGAPEDPGMVVQPLPCQHCELAPCESVCPVAATVHSPEGLNDMAYNRCIGTRYCSNNCPYKVRRFNFFQYNEGFDPVLQMQKNPDVTLRFRGVMEKCTYCVQRIQEVKIRSKREQGFIIEDGAIVPACAQACPTGAIVFGDINDPDTAVARRKREPRSYSVLVELNIRPRTTYLAKLRNPNPELA